MPWLHTAHTPVMFSDVFVVPSHSHCVWIVLVTQNKEIAHTCVQYKSNTPTVKLLIAQACILLRIIPCNVDMVNVRCHHNDDNSTCRHCKCYTI